jgi:REP element-mobilizing transposase RayT
MPYPRKSLLAWQQGMYYHIYNRGVHKVSIFREKSNYLFAISKIKEFSQAKQIAVIAYCLMPNHYHMLVRQDGNEPAGNLPQSIFNSYTKAYNKKYGHTGTLFESRFRAKAIRDKNHLLHLCRYIHGNPVKDGLVADPADWHYSNYLDWIGDRDGAIVDRTFIQNQFGSSREYKNFVDDYLKSRQLPDDLLHYIADFEK